MKQLILSIALLLGCVFTFSPNIHAQTANNGDSTSCSHQYANGCNVDIEMTEVRTPESCYVSIKFTIVCGETTCTKTRTKPCTDKETVSVMCGGNTITVEPDGAHTWGELVDGSASCSDLKWNG